VIEDQENASLNGATPAEGGEAPVRKAKAPAKPKSVKVKAPEVAGDAAASADSATSSAAVDAPTYTAPVAAAPVATAPAAPVWSGPEPTTMEELLAIAGAPIKNLKSGDVLDGVVVRVDPD